MVSSSISGSGSITAAKGSSFNFTAKADGKNLAFGQIMTQSVSSTASGKAGNDTGTVKTGSTADTKSSDTVSDSVKNNDKAASDTTKSNAAAKVSASSDSAADNARSVDTDNKANQTTNQSDMDKTDNSKIDTMLDQIKDEIKSKFGISEEDMEAAMANLGITMQDLLQPNNLTNFICSITGTQDALTLLTDSNLSEQLKSLLNFVDVKVNSLAQEMKISPQDLMAYINNAAQEQAEPVLDKTVMNQITEEKTVVGITENADTLKTQAENMPKNGNAENPDKNVNNSQQSDNLQAAVESKLTVDTERKNDGSMSKGNEESSQKSNPTVNEIANNLTQSIQTAFDNIVDSKVAAVNTTAVINQIVQAAKVTITQEISSMEIQLNPENLGKINLSVAAAKNGIITAQLTVENEAVKKAIENQLGILKENFNNQGIKIDAVEVTIASHSFEANQNLSKGDSNQEAANKKTGKSLRLDSIDDLEEENLSDEEKRVMHMLKGDDSSVEYSA